MTSLTTRAQGAIGVARAIAYYTAKGWPVFVPTSDMSRYDLVVDDGTRLLRVECKSTTRASGEVGLRTLGGNRTQGNKIKFLSATDCDRVFCVNIATGNERDFDIAELEGRSSVTIR